MIVVVDSGVWVSAIQFGGTPKAAIQAAYENGRICACSEILSEVSRILAEKFDIAPQRTLHWMRDYLGADGSIPIPASIPKVCRDPDDDMVLACAVAAGASAIISGDKDLLVLNPFGNIRILSPAEYLHLAQ